MIGSRMWAFMICHKYYNCQIKGAEKFKGDDRFWNREALKKGSRWGKNAAIENGFKYFFIFCGVSNPGSAYPNICSFSVQRIMTVSAPVATQPVWPEKIAKCL